MTKSAPHLTPIATPPSSAAGGDQALVDVVCPADTGYLSTLRLTTASLAARCELDVDEIDDVRLAIDEACALLLPIASLESTLQLRFVLTPGSIRVGVSVTTALPVAPARDALSWLVLQALTDTVHSTQTASSVLISMTKNSRTSNGGS